MGVDSHVVLTKSVIATRPDEVFDMTKVEGNTDAMSDAAESGSEKLFPSWVIARVELAATIKATGSDAVPIVDSVLFPGGE